MEANSGGDIGNTGWVYDVSFCWLFFSIYGVGYISLVGVTTVLWLSSISEWVKHKQVILLLMLIIVTGAFLRIYGIGAESVAYEEASSVHVSGMDLASIIKESANHNAPPLYLVILHFWINIFGTTEVAIRSLSTVFGVLSLLFIYKVGATLINIRVGLISCLLLTISGFWILQSQYARNYSLLLLLSLLSFLFFIQILQSNKTRYYIYYFISNLLLGYTHIFGLLVIPTQLLFFFIFWSEHRSQRAKFLSTVGITVAAFLPMVLLLGERAVHIGQHGFWLPEPGITELAMTFVTFVGAKPLPSFLTLGFFLLAFLMLLFLMLVAISPFSIRLASRVWRWRQPLKSLRSVTWTMQLYSIKEEILLIIWCTVPVIATFIESKLMTPLYSARYFSWVSPALYLLVARGLANLSKKWLVYPLILLIVLLSAYGLQVQYSTNTWPDWRSATEFVELSSKMNDILIFCAGIGLPGFEYYYEGNLPRYRVGSKDNLIDISDSLDRTIADSDRAWFILSYKCKSDSTKKHLIDRYGSESIILEKKFHGISIILIDLPN